MPTLIKSPIILFVLQVFIIKPFDFRSNELQQEINRFHNLMFSFDSYREENQRNHFTFAANAMLQIESDVNAVEIRNVTEVFSLFSFALWNNNKCTARCMYAESIFQCDYNLCRCHGMRAL